MYYSNLAVAFDGVQFEAGVNGVPVVTGRDGGMLSSVRAVDFWLLPEGNRLWARVAPGFPPETERPARAMLALQGPATGSDEPRTFLDWKHHAQAFEPFEVSIPFVPERPPAPDALAAADALTELGDDDLAGARAAGLALVQAFRRQDADAMMALLELRVRDMAAAGGIPLDRYQARARDSVTAIAAEGPVREPKAEEIQVRLVANGRAALLTVDGAELVSGPQTQFHVFVSRIGGRWVVVR